MKKTHQIRVGEKWHEYARKTSKATGKSITNITEEALDMHSGIYQQEKARSEALFKAMFPNHITDGEGQKTPKTPNPKKLSTRIGEIQKALKTGELWTSKKYSADNVHKMFNV